MDLCKQARVDTGPERLQEGLPRQKGEAVEGWMLVKKHPKSLYE